MLKWMDENGVVHDKVQTAMDRLKTFEPRGGGAQLVDLGQQQRSTEMGNPAGESQMPSTSSIGGPGCVVGKGLSATIDGENYVDWTTEWWMTDKGKDYRDYCQAQRIALADAYHKQKERP